MVFSYMLIILGGLPGSGKTTMAKALAKEMGAVHIRIDSIEQAIKRSLLRVEDVIDSGYQVGYALAMDNLRLGHTVVADSVNPIEITRSAWRKVAEDCASRYVEVEVVCSDKGEHKHRIETRESDILGLKQPSWQKVLERDYEAWTSAHIVLDTAGKTIDSSMQELLECIAQCKGKNI